MVTAILHCFPDANRPNPCDKEATDHLTALPHHSLEDTAIVEQPSLPIIITANLICFVLLYEYQAASTSQLLVLNSLLLVISRSSAIVFISKLQPASVYEQDLRVQANTIQCLGLLSTPMLAVLTLVLVVVQPKLELSSVAVISHALAQSVWWVATITIIRFPLVSTSANLDTIGFSIYMAATSTSVSSVAKGMLAILLSVAQSMAVVRINASIRRVVYFLLTVLLVGFWVRHDPRLPTVLSSDTNLSSGHPIEHLISSSRLQLDVILSRQSKTINEAVTEYQRRYGRSPPSGFDQWFKLAQENKFVLIDEFDTFMASLEPFHGVPPSILQQRVDQVLKHDAGRMAVLHIVDGNVTLADNMRDISDRLTNKTWLNIVPYNMTIMLNGWDEPMVNAPWDEVEQAMDKAKDDDRFLGEQSLKETNINPLIETGKQNGWAATARACSLHSASRQLQCPQRQLTTPISFISNATLSKDVCENCEILQQEGLLVSPGNMKVAHELVPIWSASKPSHFHDILYPSSYYIGVRGDYRAAMDMPWEDKDNKFYWVGRATGGWATSETWDHMQRQSLVLKTMPTNNDPIPLLEETAVDSNVWRPRFSTMAEIADLFATRIADVVQCTDDTCNIEKEAFGLNKDIIPADSQDAAYSHRFVMDVDGNGFSGRFYRLLQSRSVVVKQTILKEWHDDRLIPWVHYVPVSTGYGELPEMARFLASTERGLELSERIARESTAWHNKALRDVDLRLVFLRMLLEYGRVMNPGMTH